MARSHIKHGLTWSDVQDILFARNAPRKRNGGASAFYLNQAARDRAAASVKSEFDTIDGLAPRAYFLAAARERVAKARERREEVQDFNVNFLPTIRK